MSKLNNDWSDSLSDLELIKPCLESALGIELVIIDKTKDRLHAILDQIAGIDALAVKDGKAYGIAFRIQRGRNWKTFTIRSKRTTGNDTEFQKYSVEANCSKPNMTMQIYADDAGKLHVGYCKTSLLMTYAKEHETELPKRKADGEGNEFLVVEWDNKDWVSTKEIECDQCRRGKKDEQ